MEFRVEWSEETDEPFEHHSKDFGKERDKAISFARKKSKSILIVYVVAFNWEGVSIGHRSYVGGRLNEKDGEAF